MLRNVETTCDGLNVAIEFAKSYVCFGRNYDNFEKCIAPLKPTCPKTQMDGIEIFESTFSFLCEKKNLDGNDHDNDFDGTIIDIFRYTLIKVKK